MKQIIFILCSFFLVISTGYSQWKEPIGTKLERRVKQKVEEKVDKTIDKTIDNALDGNVNPIEPKSVPMNHAQDYNSSRSNKARGFMPLEPGAYAIRDTSAGQSADGNTESQAMPYGNLFGSGSKESVQPVYSFDHNIVMETEAYDSKGELEGKSVMRMLFAERSNYFAGEAISIEGIEEDMRSSTSIFDIDNNQMISLIESSGMKIGIIIAFDPEESTVDESEQAKFKKTGKTKLILGYTCDEYISDDKESISEIWLAIGEDLGFRRAMNFMSGNSKGNDAAYPTDAPSGFMMEMTSINKSNKEKVVMKVTEVNKGSKSSVSTSGYQFM